VGNADGVRTVGLAWTLACERLTAGTTRGLSNRITSSPAEVSVASGIVIVIWESSQS